MSAAAGSNAKIEIGTAIVTATASCIDGKKTYTVTVRKQASGSNLVSQSVTLPNDQTHNIVFALTNQAILDTARPSPRWVAPPAVTVDTKKTHEYQSFFHRSVCD